MFSCSPLPQFSSSLGKSPDELLSYAISHFNLFILIYFSLWHLFILASKILEEIKKQGLIICRFFLPILRTQYRNLHKVGTLQICFGYALYTFSSLVQRILCKPTADLIQRQIGKAMDNECRVIFEPNCEQSKWPLVAWGFSMVLHHPYSSCPPSLYPPLAYSLCPSYPGSLLLKYWGKKILLNKN